MDLTSKGTREVKQIHPKVNGELRLEVPASDARLARMPMVKQLPEAEEVKTVQRTKTLLRTTAAVMLMTRLMRLKLDVQSGQKHGKRFMGFICVNQHLYSCMWVPPRL